MLLLKLFLLLSCVSPFYPTCEDAVISQEFGNKGHVGIDFFVPVGTPVYAVTDGVVIKEENNARSYGRYIMILHPDGNASLYAHLSKFEVEVGEEVRGGQLVALSGGDADDNIDGDGWSLIEHLHWEVRTQGHLDNNLYNINPLEYIELLTNTRCSLKNIAS